jgi:hypothetical protein
MPLTVIENYVLPDEGWGIVLGPVVRPRPEDEHEHGNVADSDDENGKQST